MSLEEALRSEVDRLDLVARLTEDRIESEVLYRIRESLTNIADSLQEEDE